MQSERDDALDQSKVYRVQVQVMKKNTKKTLDNANKPVQNAQYSVYGARERDDATKKRYEADVNDAHLRELQNDILF